MNTILLFAALTMSIYLCRFMGFTLKIPQASSFWTRFLHYIPIAIFAALVVSALYKDPNFLSSKLIAFAAAALVIGRTKHFGLSIVVGLCVLWLLMLTGI